METTPFKMTFYVEKEEVLLVNSRGLMNFEHLRLKNTIENNSEGITDPGSFFFFFFLFFFLFSFFLFSFFFFLFNFIPISSFLFFLFFLNSKLIFFFFLEQSNWKILHNNKLNLKKKKVIGKRNLKDIKTLNLMDQNLLV